MLIDDLLIASGLITEEDAAAAAEARGELGPARWERWVEAGKLAASDLDAVLQRVAPPPRTLADTGLQLGDLLNLVLKTIQRSGQTTASRITEVLRLPHQVVLDIIQEAQDRRLLDLRGPVRLDWGSELTFGLTDRGARAAADAQRQSRYVGPAPVTLSDFSRQVGRQRIGRAEVTRQQIAEAFADMVIPDTLLRDLGAAVNDGRTMLLYGPAGNGKTSIGERIGRLFSDIIYIPYAIEVDGQIIKVFDPALHKPIDRRDRASDSPRLRADDIDARWVACRRPFVVAGGELTLEMLDLSFNPVTHDYEAPLHVKALGGVFLIDDFGRQLVSPAALLNRWILPLESRVDYLRLATGKTVAIPFDEIVIFGANLRPGDLFDPAFLRRMQYKIEVAGPDPDAFRRIFRAAAARAGLSIDNRLIEAVIGTLRDRLGAPLANYQPKFIVEQALAAAKYDGVAPRLTAETIAMALRHIAGQDRTPAGAAGAAAPLA